MAQTAAPVVEFDHVGKRYPDGAEAVADFSMVVPAGRITVLLGSSGCGKTTLLRMVNRMITPTSGRILIDGRDVAQRDPVQLRRQIGYVMQDAGLLPHKRVIDNICTVPLLNGVQKADAQARGLAMMDLVGLDRGLANRFPAQLSGGQRQRVGVARGLAADQHLLLMDEPFGAVDPIVRADLQRDLTALQRQLAKTIIFVTHDIGEAFRIGDHIVLLADRGRIAQQGTPHDLVTSPASEFVTHFIGLRTGQSALRVESVDGVEVVVDGHGRPVGKLVDGHGGPVGKLVDGDLQ